MENIKYVAYYRVSTKNQGLSGLGLDSQKTLVEKFVGCNDCIIESFTEIESGKKVNRIELNKAIESAKKNNCTLIVAKLDRLSRNVSFLFALRDSGLKILFADMPSANELQIGIMAVIAESERKTISERTKNALAEKKKQGVQLGNPQNLDQNARIKGAQAMKTKSKENPNNKKAAALANVLRSSGLSFDKIADQLNESGFKTSKNKEFTRMQVSRLITV